MKWFSLSLELLGIVLIRFPPLLRIWSVVLVVTNLGAFFFLDTIYGQVAVAALVFGLALMLRVYAQLGFVRLLGTGHVLWVPMLVWLWVKLPVTEESGMLAYWLWALMIVNSISIVVDTTDVVRYAAGERQPYYTW